MKEIAGRKHEISLMRKALDSKEAFLLAVYGRRRIGKTFLIEQVYAGHIQFELIGLHNASLKEQLTNFAISLGAYTKKYQEQGIPGNWLEAFEQLKNYLSSLPANKKQVLFFDEFPWLDSKRSGFLAAFEHFWNSWAVRQSHILVVVCGSAASWMLKKVVHNRGGLHNRITQSIRMLPFTLAETYEFLRLRHVKLGLYDIVQLYMCMGGVPHYLKGAEPGQSAVQIINNLAFNKDGLLAHEHRHLFPSLFSKPQLYEEVIRVLASKRMGITRQQLIDALSVESGGHISTILSDLEECGFIELSWPFDKKTKDALYRINDEYLLFYYRFIEKQGNNRATNWLAESNSSAWKAWAGFAFEGICLKHTEAIKNTMGISGLSTTQAAWIFKGKEGQPGAQIDMLMDRPDNTITIFEAKFANDVLTLTQSDAAALKRKMNTFKSVTKTKKSLMCCMITPFGVEKNEHYLATVSHQLMLEDLFGLKQPAF